MDGILQFYREVRRVWSSIPENPKIISAVGLAPRALAVNDDWEGIDVIFHPEDFELKTPEIWIDRGRNIVFPDSWKGLGCLPGLGRSLPITTFNEAREYAIDELNVRNKERGFFPEYRILNL